MTKTTLVESLNAGNLRVRFDEGIGASAKPRRKILSYNGKFVAVVLCALLLTPLFSSAAPQKRQKREQILGKIENLEDIVKLEGKDRREIERIPGLLLSVAVGLALDSANEADVKKYGVVVRDERDLFFKHEKYPFQTQVEAVKKLIQFATKKPKKEDYDDYDEFSSRHALYRSSTACAQVAGLLTVQEVEGQLPKFAMRGEDEIQKLVMDWINRSKITIEEYHRVKENEEKIGILCGSIARDVILGYTSKSLSGYSGGHSWLVGCDNKLWDELGSKSYMIFVEALAQRSDQEEFCANIMEDWTWLRDDGHKIESDLCERLSNVSEDTALELYKKCIKRKLRDEAKEHDAFGGAYKTNNLVIKAYSFLKSEKAQDEAIKYVAELSRYDYYEYIGNKRQKYLEEFVFENRKRLLKIFGDDPAIYPQDSVIFVLKDKLYSPEELAQKESAAKASRGVFDGIFGQKFGDVVDVSAGKSYGEYSESFGELQDTHLGVAFCRVPFKPKKVIPEFQSYYVWVTYDTHKIFAIEARSDNALPREKEAVKPRLVFALEKKYQSRFVQDKEVRWWELPFEDEKCYIRAIEDLKSAIDGMLWSVVGAQEVGAADLAKQRENHRAVLQECRFGKEDKTLGLVIAVNEQFYAIAQKETDELMKRGKDAKAAKERAKNAEAEASADAF